MHDGTLDFLASHDIIGVFDTRNNPALVTALSSTHHAFVKTDPRSTPGSGAAVLVAKGVLHVVQFVGFHPRIPLAWLRVHDTFIGFLYARPSLISSTHQQVQFLSVLHDEVVARQVCGRVVLLGDFNARLGDLPDGSDLPRRSVGPHNEFGSLLMGWASTVSLMTLTGRLDDGECTWRSGERSSRIDHAFVEPESLHAVTSWQVTNDFYGSDHKPMCMCLAVSNMPAPPVAAARLRWDFHKHAAYSDHIARDQAAALAIHSALDAGDVALADRTLTSLIHSAAEAAGMLCTPSRTRKPRALPLGQDALAVRAEVRRLRQAGQPVPPGLRHLWRSHVRTARQLFAEQARTRMREYLRDNPRIFWQTYNNRYSQAAAGVQSTDQWRDHYQRKFGDAVPAGVPLQPQSIPTDPHCVLMRPVTQLDVTVAFKQLGTAKAPGADGLPAEFVTKPRTQADGVLLLGVVTRMCNVVLQLGRMPESWKVKAVTPVFKAGPRCDPGNYRPIAVATTFYRIFTAIFAHRLTAFLHHEQPPGRLLDSQFAFRRGLSTEHAHLLLTTCCNLSLARGEPMALVQLDISQAYDTVDRDLLWVTLRQHGMPAAFVTLMQELYRDVPYVVRVNGQLSSPFYTSTGVMQGCALSPSLYNKYLRDCLAEVEQRCQHMGVRLRPGGDLHCVQADFADDIHGTVALRYVGDFVAIVEEVLAAKGQRLNRAKCKVLVVSRRPPASTHVAGLPVVPCLKILGLLYTHNSGWEPALQARAQQGASKTVLHMSRLYKFGCHRDLHMASLMNNVDVRPTLLFGASIWGGHGLAYEDPMAHKLQKAYSVLPREALGQPHCTAHWTITLMSGHMPLQHWVVRDFCRMWNRLLAVAQHNVLLSECVTQQLALLRANRSCWLKRWHDALRRLLPDVEVHGRLAQRLPVVESEVLDGLVHWYGKVLRAKGAHFILGPCPHRKIAYTYAMLFHCYLPGAGAWGRVPRPIAMSHGMPVHVREAWLHLFAGNAQVPARNFTCIKAAAYHHRLCAKCTMGVVADESHVFLRCPATAFTRDRFRLRLQWSNFFPTFVASNTTPHHHHVATFVHEALQRYHRAPVAATDDMTLWHRQLLLAQGRL